MENPISKAAAIIGSKASMARLIGVSSPTVHEWESGGKPAPIERCVQIEQATKGVVMRWDLRPNDWWLIWPELKDRSDSPPLPTEEVSHG